MSLIEADARLADLQPHTVFRGALVAISIFAVVILLAQPIEVLQLSPFTVVSYAGAQVGLVFVILCIAFIWQKASGQIPKDLTALAGLRHFIGARPQSSYGDMIAAWLAFAVTVSAFTIYKTQSVGAEGYAFDSTFIAWDRAILGADAWTWTHALWSSAQATAVLDFIYHPAFLPMALGFALALACTGRAALRYTYVCTYLASYVVIGMIMAGALHSAGPIYDGALYGDGTTFAPLIARLETQAAESGQMVFSLAQSYLLSAHMAGEVSLGTGISAMPSMHVALAAMCVFAAWHFGVISGVVATAYGLLIWAISVHLGWHYFVDGLVSVAVLMPIWYGFGWLFGLYGRGDEARG